MALRILFLSFSIIFSIESMVAQSLEHVNAQYSLYLPKSFEKHKKLPLLIFLDPAARGDLPVNKYKQVADDNEIIIVGSFDSRNFDPQSSVISIKTILNDIAEKYLIDTSKIWLSGFSGGARVATAYAVTDNRITGVIACGAGFASEDFINIDHTIAFTGIVGFKDMNFEEITGIGTQLSRLHKEHLLLFFNGGHQWPPAIEMSLAVQWLMKSDASLSDNPIIQNLIYFGDSIANNGTLYLAWLQLNEYEKIFSNATKIYEAKKKLEDQKLFKKDKNLYQSIMNDERQFMDEFSFLFSQTVYTELKEAVNKDIWKGKFNKINYMRRNKNKYPQLSADRLFDFSWRLCIEQYNYLMRIEKFVQAYKAATILSLLKVKHINAEQLILKAKNKIQ